MRLTAILAQVIGLFTVITTLAMLLQRRMTEEVISSLIANRALLYVVGLIATLCGLLIVLSHNVWKGGALPIVVTLLGWLILLRGILFLVLPRETIQYVYRNLNFRRNYPIIAAVGLGLGLLLTYAGFTD